MDSEDPYWPGKNIRNSQIITYNNPLVFSIPPAFLPGMADEEVAVQTIWMLHQGPTDLARFQRHRFDELVLVAVPGHCFEQYANTHFSVSDPMDSHSLLQVSPYFKFEGGYGMVSALNIIFI